MPDEVAKGMLTVEDQYLNNIQCKSKDPGHKLTFFFFFLTDKPEKDLHVILFVTYVSVIGELAGP